jgi:cyclase
MHRSVIVAKITPGSEPDVARVFAESDRTDLPLVAGVLRRDLYSLADLYVHILETHEPAHIALAKARSDEEFGRIGRRLEPFIAPYLPTWRSPRDALARCFYTWQAGSPGPGAAASTSRGADRGPGDAVPRDRAAGDTE